MNHKKIIKSLYSKLNKHKSLTDILNREEEYKIFFQHCERDGEIDLYYIHNNRAWVFEVKSRDHDLARYKAYHQLHKDEEFIKENFPYVHTIFSFYVHTDEHQKNKFRIEYLNKKLNPTISLNVMVDDYFNKIEDKNVR